MFRARTFRRHASRADAFRGAAPAHTLRLFMTLAAAILVLAGCGSHGSIAPGSELTLFQPTTLYSNGSAAMRLLGRGFGARKSVVQIRFTATSGTPFANGTSATFLTTGIVDSDVQIRGTAPASFVNQNIDAIVEVILGNGDVIASDGAVANFVKQDVLSITPTSVSSGATPAYEITGLGFQPPLGLVTVRFDAVVGTPFGAGASSSITTIGTVNSDTSITGLLPDGQVAFDTDATVTVILPDGASISSAGPLIHWVPVPTVSSFNPSTIPGGVTLPFTIGGTAFAPTGTNAIVTLEAVTGTPFFGGTQDTISFAGTVDGPTQISGTTPNLDPSVTGLAYVRVTLQGGSTAISIIPLVQFLPAPSISAFTPGSVQSGNANPWQATAPNTTFSITGANFGPTGVIPTVLFTAASGTPFNNGTSATFSAPATVTSSTNLSGNFADPLSNAAVQGSFVVTWPNGASAASAPNIFSVVLPPPLTLPTWDNTALSGTISGVSDDSSTSASFAGGFTFPFFGTSYSGGFCNGNGSFSFNSGTTDFSQSTGEFTGLMPRICPYWGDLSPQSGSGYYFNTSAHTDRAVNTWLGCPDFNGTGTVTMQIAMWNNGRIDLVYNGMSASSSGIMGITPGGGASLNTVDWSSVAYPACASTTAGAATGESFGGASDMGSNWILLYPRSATAYDWARGP